MKAAQSIAAPGNQPTFWQDLAPAGQDRRTALPAHLTPRQLEVLALLCEGLPNKLICRRLNIATGTVKVHISCILRELGAASRLQAVLMASQFGGLGEAKAEQPGRAYPAEQNAIAVS